jgi:hypothetical protein
VAEFFEDVAIKLLGIVDSYFPWHSEAADYVLQEKTFEPRCYDID